MVYAGVKQFTLSELPYNQNALAPTISAETVSYHYDKHHRAYVDKLNERVSGTELGEFKLEEVMVRTAGDTDKADIFNNAAQVWNHDFYWSSLSPDGGGKPAGDLAHKIEANFGSYENFLKVFIEAGMTRFGSGWVWLVEDQGALKVAKTADAENPVFPGHGKALLAVDVWEHAYYLDYQNRRIDYLKAILDKLIHWRFAEMNLASPMVSSFLFPR